MLEAISVIAVLCQIGSGTNVKSTTVEQARCHKHYVKCIENLADPDYGKRLAKCILKKGKVAEEGNDNLK